MKQGIDLQQMIEVLRAKRRYRNIGHAKLTRMLECAELNVPKSWLHTSADTSLLFNQLQKQPPLKRNAAARIPKKALWALLPAGVAAAILLFYITGPLDFMRSGRSGTAGIVSGDVMLRRGGSERALRAGDVVARNDVIITGVNSSADIQFTNLLRMRVLGGSRIALRTIALDERVRAFDALVTGGGCLLDVNKLVPGESVSIHTPESAAVVRGTRFGVMVDGTGGVRYEVFEGKVRVRRCLPPDSPVTRAAAEMLDRYFKDHAVDVSPGQACAIGRDTLPRQPISGAGAASIIASLALPAKVPGILVMKDDMDRLIKSAGGRGGRPVFGSGQGIQRNLFSARNASPERGMVFLIYIPVLDCVLRFGDRSLISVRSDEVQWTVPLDGPIHSLPVYESTSLYVSTGRGTITKIDLFTGGTQWKARVAGAASGDNRLVLDGSGLYCAASPGILCKFDRSGEVLWSIKTGEFISTVPVITDQLIFVSTQSGSLFGFDKSNGMKVISVSVRGSIVSIAAMKKNIFIATDAGRLYCYNYRDDEMLWEYQVNDALAGDMVVASHSVYLFGRAGRIYRISTEGNLIWNRDIGIPIVKRPSDDASSFYIPASESLFVVDKITGDVTWSLLVPRITSGNVAVSKGHIYFETGNKRLSSLKK